MTEKELTPTVARSMSKPAGSACANCPGRDSKCAPPEPADGRARLAVVGESPGYNELRRGRPFIGKSGKLMVRGVGNAVLKRHEVHWTNAVLCEVKPGKELAAARKCCAERLRRELQAVAPKVVWAVGAHGLKSILGSRMKGGIIKWRGSVSTIKWQDGAPADWADSGVADAYLCPTIHPAFAMRDPRYTPILELDGDRVARVLHDGWKPPELQADRELRIAKSEKDVIAGLDEMSAASHVGFDVETVGLGATHTRLVSLAISDGRLSLALPWSTASDGQICHWQDDGVHLSRLLSWWMQQRVAITHNGPIFDHIVAERYGIVIGDWEDTIQLAHALESQFPKGLDTVATRYLDVPPWKHYEHSKSLDDLLIYNARDSLYTALLWHAMKRRDT